MADTGARTLRLLALLQTHRHWTGTELARRLEVSPRTVRRDVERLRELGYPVQAAPGVDGGYQLVPGAALPPLVVDDDEAVALAVGMQAATTGALAGIEEAAVSALTKVVQVMPARLRARVDAVRAVTEPVPWEGPPAPVVDPATLVLLAQTCRDHERLEFAYTARDSASSSRRVEPHRLVPLGRRWYLVAYDLDRHDWRSFRLDRLSAPRRTGTVFGPRTLPAPDAATFVRNAVRAPARPVHDVEVLVHAPAEIVRERVGQWAGVHAVGPGLSRLTMVSDDLHWPAFALGVVREPFEVLAPPELAEIVREWGDRFTAATTRGRAGTGNR